MADLIDAETQAAARIAGGQLSGSLSRRIGTVYDALVDVSAHFHAVLDYPEEDIDAFGAETLDRTLGGAERDLSALLDTYRRGKLLVGGIPCAIVGRPNAGKSSLLNALLGYERAIVTDIPGTTRDTVEEKCALGGRLLRLIDTAGIRETGDAVERIGVERSRRALAGAELALVLVDLTRPLDEADEALFREAVGRAGQVILVGTKADLPRAGTLRLPWTAEKPVPVVSLSSRTGEGLPALEEAIAACFPSEGGEERGEMSERPAGRRGWTGAGAGPRRPGGPCLGMTPDAVLVDVEGAMEALGGAHRADPAGGRGRPGSLSGSAWESESAAGGGRDRRRPGQSRMKGGDRQAARPRKALWAGESRVTGASSVTGGVRWRSSATAQSLSMAPTTADSRQ